MDPQCLLVSICGKKEFDFVRLQIDLIPSYLPESASKNACWETPGHVQNLYHAARPVGMQQVHK